MARADRTSTDPAALFSARRAILTGSVALAALIGGFGVWGATARLSGAVIAPGQVEVANSRQVVQHLDGGIVSEILVKEGDRVTAGDILIRLDGSSLLSELAIVEGQYFETMARRARLEAERDDRPEVAFPSALLDEVSDRPELADVTTDQVRLFVARREGLQQKASQIDKRLEQIDSQLDGMRAQIAALETQLDLARTEEANQQSLLDKGLAQAQRVLALKREVAQIEGEIGALIASEAQARGRATELEIERDGLYSAHREAAISELREVSNREVELAERRRALSERASRLDIRAPVSGIVLGLQVTTPLSVLRPADPVLYIIPQDRPLIVAAQIPPIHVDQVHVGQEVRLHFSAFNSRTTPEIEGRVAVIGADALRDDRTMMSHYRVEIDISPDQIDRLGDEPVVPGMPVEAFIKTEDRSPFSYLIKPFADYFNRALRET